MAAERQPLRILMTADTVGGVWQYALELARQLCAGGDEVVLAALGPLPDEAQRRQAAAIPGLVLHAHACRLLWMEDPWEDVQRAGEWLLALEARVRPHVVHLNDFGAGALPWRAPVLLVGHSCVLSWWRAVHGGAPPAHWQRYAQAVGDALEAADLVIAPSRAMLQALHAHYGFATAAAVIHNGCQRAPLPDLPRQPRILAAGRLWDEAKNILALARVAPALPWPVRLAGQASAPGGASAALAGVQLLGMLDRQALAREMAQAAIYALPARYEPFGLSALEAAQAGCALVLGDIPSLREVWREVAVFVPPHDDAALQAALQRLIGQPPLRLRMAALARERAARYCPATMAAAYRRRYRQLAGGIHRVRPAAAPLEATP